MNNKQQRNRLFTMLMLVMALLIPQWTWAQMASQPLNGDGSADNPYQITKAEELAWFRNQVNSGNNSLNARLTEDIDLKDFCHPADEAKNTAELSWEPIGVDYQHTFKGSFDGNGKTISNLYIKTSKQYAGLFGNTSQGVIKNIKFQNANVVSTASCTGILAGQTGSNVTNIKTLSGCTANGADNTGGIVGLVGGGDISNCENHATVNGTSCVGGICGSFSGSMSSCANYGTVSSSGNAAGGLIGYFTSGTAQDCANYGGINACSNVGGIAGYFSDGKIKNVLGCGDVNATQNDKKYGILIGSSFRGTAGGVVAFCSEAKLTYGTDGNKTELAARAFGDGNITSEMSTGCTTELLRSGAVAWLLQKNASEGAAWGQLLGTDAYPAPGSGNTVYPVGTVTLSCQGELNGNLTNTQPAQEGTFTMLHSANTVHHERVESTCTQNGNIEYWYCDICNKNFSDEQMTCGVQDVTLSAPGHDYDSNDVCTRCHKSIPCVTFGNNVIQINKVTGSRSSINGYNLYKYVAADDGTLEVETQGSANTYGTLWASRSAKSSLCSDDNSGSDNNFKLTWQVTKGTVYYIGARQYSGNAIDGDVTLHIALNGIDYVLPEGMTGLGTKAEPFVIKKAEHLAWFRDKVNGGEYGICAKIADDVEVIDMSAVCHAADEAKNTAELSWEPIGVDYQQFFKGSFDGNGKTISNLYIKAGKQFAGLFGRTSQGVIKNLTFQNAKVENSYSNTGILAGSASSTIINIKTLADCSVSGKFTTGGIVGSGGDISNCENHATVNGTSRIGGISGEANNSSKALTSCVNYGTVSGSENTVGGVIGYFVSGTVQDCANYGGINAPSDVGGIAGYVYQGKIKNVLGCGDVNATQDDKKCGIIIGYSNMGTAEGVVAFNSEAKLTYGADGNKTELDARAFGDGNLKNDIDNVKPCDKTLLRSGAVAYLLNGSTSTPAEGETLRWYQKLGDNADAYPVLISTGENTVYEAPLTSCDGGSKFGDYANKPEGDTISTHKFLIATTPDEGSTNLYSEICTLCNSVNKRAKHIKGFCGVEGNDIKLTVGTDGAYTATEAVSISDATPYDSPVDFIVPTLNYTRTYLGDNKWQAAYVPFETQATDWTDNGITAASINNFHEYELEDGGYETVLEVKKATSGVLEANTPYVVRASDSGSKTITVNNVKLYKAESKNYYCMSMTRRYDFTGIYKAQSGFNSDESVSSVDYALGADGAIGRIGPSATLNPQRWYLTVSDRKPSGAQLASQARSIRIDMIGEGATTGIKDVLVVTSQNDDGTRRGIYDLQGRKLNQEPAHGVYIKNGKKYVK